uniref:URB1 ribosome biogenesis homolog n=1 Tax=Cyclopterus lumpus TaxID=8103 RepID=A0A8C2ZS25_CYCLU
MGKKRRSEDSAESNTPLKKEVPEFNGTVFKAMLKEPTTAMKGLETFISTAKKLPCTDLYDVVEGYIKISMECADIFKLLESEKHIESEMMLIFETLEMILLRTASDLSHFSMVGNAIVKKTLSSYVKLLQGSFHSENHRLVRQCLSLLSASVTQGPEAAREILSHIHINKALSGLAKRKDKRGRPDIRMAFIQFVLSFLVSGDNATVGQILESLKEDRMSMVNLLLSTLKTRVVLNKGISKTQKVCFFTPAVLTNIASLYKWNGIVDATTDDDRVKDSVHAGISVIRELAHGFLLDLCCSRKHGISFHDASFGTAGRAGNIVLLQFLVWQKQATEDELVMDLVVNVLKANPDLLARYFQETQYSYTPRLKSAWQDNVKLLKKIYEAQPEISTVFQTHEVIPLPRLLSMIMMISLPPVCDKAFFRQGLSLTNTAVQLTTLSMLNFILKRASMNMEYLLDKSQWHSSDVYTLDMMVDLVLQYRETLSKILPNITSIVAKWQLLSKKEKTDGEGKKTNSEGSAEQTDNKTAEVILLKTLILQVICLYQKVVPHLVSQSTFDFSKLLKGIVSEKGMREEVPPVLQYQILQLALDLPASKFSWFQSSSGEKPVLYLLLKLFVSSSSSHLKTSTQMLVLKVLKDSGVFEYTWTELELWLDQLAKIEAQQQETVIQFLERVLVTLVCNSYTYTDKVASLVQEAAYLQANLSSQEADAASIPVSHIDDVLDMLDVILEGNEGEMEELGPSLSEDLIIQTFPFSVMVPAALEARNKLPADKGVVYEYLSAVLSDVLHCQREPLPLCLALLQYDKQLVTAELSASPHPSIIHLHQYYSKWLPQQCREQLVCFCWNQEINVEGTLAAMLMTDFPVAIKQMLLYIKSTVENLGTILVSALDSIFKHPCLEQWFLSLELAALPPHTLNPVRLKHLCAQLNDDILALLKTSTPTLHDLGRLELISSYMGAIEKAVLKELMEKGSQAAKKQSRPFQALLSLHSYMDSCNLREVVSMLLLLPQESLISPSSEGTQAKLSVYGHAALQILTESKANPSQDHGICLSQAHLRGLSTLLLSCSSSALEAFLLQTLSSEPGSAKLIHTDVLLHCLQWPLPDTQAISSLLLQNCSTHRLCFEMWCLEPANTEKLSDQMETFLPLVNTYLQVASREDPARPKDEVVKALKQALLAKLSQCVLGNLTEDSGAQLAETLANLIKLSANIKDTMDLINTVPSALQEVDSFERWQLVDVITEKLADCPEEQETWRKSVITAALKCLLAAFSHSKDPATLRSKQEQSILERLQGLLTSAEDITASEWNSFVKNGLKYRYRDHHFLNTLSNLVEVMYGSSEVQKDLIPLSTLHMMTSSHSLFLPSMLDCDEEPSRNNTLLSPQLCILSFLWGPAAVEHHKTRKSLGASLWKQASSDDLLALLRSDRMLQTIAHFPQQRRIILQDNKELLYCNNAGKDLENLYDPRFLLPLFSTILQPECVIDCLKFVSSHALGVTVMALSSYDPKVRAAAYHVLSCFYQHLEGARVREKRQLLYLMDTVKNGIRQPNQRLPFVLTTYIAKVAQQMLKPEEHMYMVLNRFLLSHQSLDFRRVPEFFKLFYGFDLEHKREREWILSVLEEGISDEHCYELCEQQGIFQTLLGFSSSPLCDEHCQIIRVLCQAARVTRAAYNLTKSCGLLAWIIQMVEKRNLDQQLLSAIIDLLHVLWFTNLGQKETPVDEAKTTSSTEEKPRSSVKCLPLPLISEFLCVATTISRHLSSFLQTLCSVLKHCGTAVSVNKQAGWLTLHPQPLSCTEALTLLLCWTSLSRDTALLTQIQTVCEKHRVWELLGIRKDKAKGKGSFSQSHTRKENLAEDADTEKQDKSLLTECKMYLAGILVHWEPVCPLSEPQPAEPRDKLNLSPLAGDTAHLLTKWSLRCLVEDSYDENRTKEFLHWVEKTVIKHREIVNAVLLDSGMKADILRLYHQAFEAQGQSSISPRVETLQLFTTIMLRLLEAQGHLPELHQAVVSACLPEDAHDQSRRVAGLFLCSSYIHELWSGATSAELLLSHVSLVTRAKSKTQKASKSSPAQTAIRAICNDITAIKS